MNHTISIITIFYGDEHWFTRVPGFWAMTNMKFETHFFFMIDMNGGVGYKEMQILRTDMGCAAGDEGRWGENHSTMAIFLSSLIGASSTHEGLAVARLDSQRICVIPGCRLLHTSNSKCLRQDCNRSIQILDFRPAADLPKGFERLWTPSAWPHCRNRLPSICTRLMFPYCYSGFQLEVSEKSWGYPNFHGLFQERNQLLGVPGYLPRNKPRNGELHRSADPEDEKARAVHRWSLVD